MKTAFVAILCLSLALTAVAGDAGYLVKYDGGSVPELKAGSDVRLHIAGDQIQVTKGKSLVATIPASAVTEISYGQDVHRRVGTAVAIGVFSFGIGALTALSKS